jgi:peptide/nickel transport system permease protein
MGLREYVIRRLIQLVISVFLFITIMFFIFRLMPGDPLSLVIEEFAIDPEARERLIKLWGLDKPPHEQYFIYIT